MSQTQAVPESVAAPDSEVAEKLAEYDDTRSPLALKEAADAAAQHDRQAAPDPIMAEQLGRQRVAGWLAIFERLKRDLDPAFDPSKPPPRRAEPPLTPTGTQLPPGANPDDIKDPETRRAYVAAIEQHRERVLSFKRNAELYRAHTVIMERAPPSIADAHQTLGMPTEEIAAMIAAADIRADDRDALQAASR